MKTLLLAALLTALPPAPWKTPLYHVSFSEQKGAPANINSITQTADGWMWFATEDGVYRYDGIRFERVDQIQGQSLLSSNVAVLYAEGNRLWAGYQFGGVSRFDGGAVRNYGAEQGLPRGAVTSFQRAPDGTLWASGSALVAYLKDDRWHQLPLEVSKAALHTRIYITDAGDVWIINKDKLFHVLPGQQVVAEKFELPNFFLAAIFPDGRIWGTRNTGQFWEFVPATHSFHPVALPGLSGWPVNVQSDRRGHIWAATSDKVFLYDAGLHLLQSFDGKNAFHGLSYRMPTEDREGNLWFGSLLGIDMVRQSKLAPLPLPTVWENVSVAIGGDTVWVGSDNDTTVAPFVASGAGMPSSALVGGVVSSHGQPDGVIWYGTRTALFRVGHGRSQRFPLPPELGGYYIQSISADRQGKLWVSILRHGIYSFKDGVWLAGDGRSDLGDTAVIVMSDPQDRLWMGYPNGRVAVLEQGRLRRFGAEDGVDIGNVLSLSNRHGRPWIGGEYGVAWFDGRRFHPLRDASGQPYRGVSGLVETAAGDLWLNGSDGLTHIRADDLRSALQSGSNQVPHERFDIHDGLIGKPAQLRPLPTLLEARDGKLWYTTGNNIGAVDPLNLQYNRLPPPVEIQTIRDGRQVWPARAQPLALPAGANELQIDYTALSFTMPGRVRFRYRLDGIDHDWKEVGTRRSAYYTDLAPGSYRFQVVAANEDGVWNTVGATQEFAIAPTITQSRWFRALLALALALGLWWLHKYRVRKAAALVRGRLEERLNERGRIARELHDTLLQSVQGVILKVRAVALDMPPELLPLRQEIDATVHQATAALEEGRNRVQDLRTWGEDRNSLEAMLRVAAGELSQLSAEPEPQLRVRRQHAARPLHPVVEEELVAIAHEALINAYRHAQAAAIDIELDYGGRQFRLSVTDDGCGIPPAVLAAHGRERHWGLPGMRERADRIGARLALHSEAAHGTRVVVTLPASLAYRQRRRWLWWWAAR
jgi:signal transduction histidine kinase/ligand-binding sensor domain-containing protein